MTIPLLYLVFSTLLGCFDTRVYDDRETDWQSDDSLGDTEDTDTGTDTGSAPISLCPATLSERMTIHSIEMDDDIHYLSPGYNSIARAARLALARQPNGSLTAAWLNAARDTLHVTPLTQTFERRAEDITIQGTELGGLIARDDGFALLIRREDTGEDVAVGEDDRPVQAAVWIRHWFDDKETLAVPLTGSESPHPALDYSNGLRGSLVFDGDIYSAYFEVRGGRGGDHPGGYGDKMVRIDDAGTIRDGGWRFATGTLTGTTALLVTADRLAAFVFADAAPNPGLNIIESQTDTRLVAEEESWSGYSGGELGGVVSLSNTTFVAWASRGFDDEAEEAEYDTHDVVMIIQPEMSKPSPARIRLTRTPDIDEINVHLAPYGDEQLLLIWNETHDIHYEEGTAFGTYAGTYFQRFDLQGEPVAPKERIDAPPTIEQQLVRLDNGDLAFAFVTDTIDYTDTLARPSETPLMRTLNIAHLSYCTEDDAP